jgi:hypothetical protein
MNALAPISTANPVSAGLVALNAATWLYTIVQGATLLG